MARAFRGFLCAAFVATLSLGMIGCGGSATEPPKKLSSEENEKLKALGQKIFDDQKKATGKQ
jgi:hypothetical protein